MCCVAFLILSSIERLDQFVMYMSFRAIYTVHYTYVWTPYNAWTGKKPTVERRLFRETEFFGLEKYIAGKK